MTEPVDPMIDYLDSINQTLLGIGVMLKQLLDTRAGRDTGPVQVHAAAPVPQPPAPVMAPSQPPYAPLDTWRCSVHGTSKVVPAGISQKTGRAYDAFIVCGERGCEQKPPRAAAPARAVPPSYGGQMP